MSDALFFTSLGILIGLAAAIIAIVMEFQKVKERAMNKNFANLTMEALLRKREQHAEMASLAVQDGDQADAQRHYALEKAYTKEIQERNA